MFYTNTANEMICFCIYFQLFNENVIRTAPQLSPFEPISNYLCAEFEKTKSGPENMHSLHFQF